MARPGSWLRAAGSNDFPAVNGERALVGVAAGRTTTRTVFYVEFYWADRDLLVDDFPVPEVAWGIYPIGLSDPASALPSPIADRNAGWLWWEALNWTSETWYVAPERRAVPQTLWVARGRNGLYVDTSAQRTFPDGARWWLKWESEDPVFPIVHPRITFSQFNLLPP